MKQLLFLLLFPCLCLAQYQGNANQKITLGEQTTADGLVWRGRTSDTANLLTNKLDTSVYIVLDTGTQAMWYYRVSTTPKWTRLVDSLNNLQGTLSVAKGGTGSTTQNFVDLTTTQSVNSVKTFLDTIIVNKGIRFPSNEITSTNSNTLDDYEEGTWTPAIKYNTTNTPIHSYQTGRYTKIGSLVQITFILSFNENGSSGSYIVIEGLPYTVKNTIGAKAAVTIQSYGLINLPLNISLNGRLDYNTKNIELQLNDNIGTFLTNLYTDNDQDIYGFVVYEAN
jgi:hypothetical protein